MGYGLVVVMQGKSGVGELPVAGAFPFRQLRVRACEALRLCVVSGSGHH